MKLKLKILTLILVLIISCDVPNSNKKDQIQRSQDHIEVQGFDLKNEEGFEEFKVNNFLSEKILIGEKEKF